MHANNYSESIQRHIISDLVNEFNDIDHNKLAETFGIDETSLNKILNISKAMPDNYQCDQSPEKILSRLVMIVQILRSLSPDLKISEWFRKPNDYFNNEKPIDLIRIGKSSVIVDNLVALATGNFVI